MTTSDINNSICEWTAWANQEGCKRYDIALLKIWIQFERFMGALFVTYATGGASETGYRPSLKVQFIDEEHLNAFLRSENRKYVDYLTSIRTLSKHVFLNDPFGMAIFSNSDYRQKYEQIIAIRNYVAHESGEARLKFISQCCEGDSSRFCEPNEYLQKKRKASAQTHYSEFIEAISGMAQILINPPT